MFLGHLLSSLSSSQYSAMLPLTRIEVSLIRALCVLSLLMMPFQSCIYLGSEFTSVSYNLPLNNTGVRDPDSFVVENPHIILTPPRQLLIATVDQKPYLCINNIVD